MQKVLGNLSRGLLFIVSAPAGTGKTTLTQMLALDFPCVVQSISYTTRPIREGETTGEHYHFINREQFLKKIEQDEFLEYAEIYGNFYGTSRKWVEEKRAEGKHVVLVIDTQGAMKLKGKCDATYLFIMPPTIETLRHRLERRRTEPSEVIEKRLEWAKNELKVGKEYDYVIINDHLETAYQVFRSIFIATEHENKYMINPGE